MQPLPQHWKDAANIGDGSYWLLSRWNIGVFNQACCGWWTQVNWTELCGWISVMKGLPPSVELGLGLISERFVSSRYCCFPMAWDHGSVSRNWKDRLWKICPSSAYTWGCEVLSDLPSAVEVDFIEDTKRSWQKTWLHRLRRDANTLMRVVLLQWRILSWRLL